MLFASLLTVIPSFLSNLLALSSNAASYTSTTTTTTTTTSTTTTTTTTTAATILLLLYVWPALGRPIPSIINITTIISVFGVIYRGSQHAMMRASRALVQLALVVLVALQGRSRPYWGTLLGYPIIGYPKIRNTFPKTVSGVLFRKFRNTCHKTVSGFCFPETALGFVPETIYK